MKKKCVTLFLIFCAVANAGAEILELPQYLKQVEQSNENVRGALQLSRGSSERSAEGKLMFSPAFYAVGYTMDDKRDTIMAVLTGDEAKASGTEIGISQLTRSGTGVRLSYGITNTEMINASPLYISMPKFTDTSVKIELEQPLWKNSFGRQYKNTEIAGEAQAKAVSYAKLYEAQMLLLDAEIKYWKLSGIRESIKVLSTSLEKTKEILKFNSKQFKRNLVDINVVLQCEAQVKARNLDLISIISDEKEAMQALNEARKFDAEVIEEDTPLPDTKTVLEMLCVPINRCQMRNDVKAAEQGVLAQNAADKINKERTVPELSVFTVASLNSRKGTADESMGNTLNSDYPYYEVGVKFSVPLNSSLVSKIHSGYDNEINGAKLQYNQKKYKQDKEWAMLERKLKDVKDRLAATEELEKAQLVKLEKESERQKQGQSTLFQVFIFEQEYLASQLNLISIRGTALGLVAQAKTFSEYNGSNGGLK